MDVLLDLFVGGLKAEYAHPHDEGVYFEKREGGYQWSTQTTAELVAEPRGVPQWRARAHDN